MMHTNLIFFLRYSRWINWCEHGVMWLKKQFHSCIFTFTSFLPIDGLGDGKFWSLLRTHAHKLNGNPVTDLCGLYRDLGKNKNTHLASVKKKKKHATTKRWNLAADGICSTRKRHRCRIFPEKLSLVSTSSPTSPHALLRGSIQLPFHLCIIRSSKDWYYHRLQVPRPLSINVPFWLVGVGI